MQTGTEQLESKLYNFIKELYEEIKDMCPEDGFSSPRDIELVNLVNQKCVIMDDLQKAMRRINPHFEIREN